MQIPDAHPAPLYKENSSEDGLRLLFRVGVGCSTNLLIVAQDIFKDTRRANKVPMNRCVCIYIYMCFIYLFIYAYTYIYI